MKGSFEITIGFFLPNKSVFFDGLHTVHPVIVSFARGVLGVKITKNICDESASHRKGVVKIDPRNSIPSWWWCFTSPFKKSTRWLSILAEPANSSSSHERQMQRHSLVWDFGLSLTLQVFAERTKCPCVKRQKSHGQQLRKFDGVRNCPKFK